MHLARPRVIGDTGRSLSVIINADLDVFHGGNLAFFSPPPFSSKKYCYSTFVTPSSVTRDPEVERHHRSLASLIVITFNYTWAIMYCHFWFIEVGSSPLIPFCFSSSSSSSCVCFLSLFSSSSSSSSSSQANQATPPWQPSARVKHPQMVLSRASSRRTTRSSVGECVCVCVCLCVSGRERGGGGSLDHHCIVKRVVCVCVWAVVTQREEEERCLLREEFQGKVQRSRERVLGGRLKGLREAPSPPFPPPREQEGNGRWANINVPRPRVDQTELILDSRIHTQPHTRSPLTHAHHSLQTPGPRCLSQRSRGDKRTLAPARVFFFFPLFEIKGITGFLLSFFFLKNPEIRVLTFSKHPHSPPSAQGAKMSCRRRCKREIFKFAQYLFRFITGTLNTGKTPGRTLRCRVHFPRALDSLRSAEMFVSSSRVKFSTLLMFG